MKSTTSSGGLVAKSPGGGDCWSEGEGEGGEGEASGSEGAKWVGGVHAACALGLLAWAGLRVSAPALGAGLLALASALAALAAGAVPAPLYLTLHLALSLVSLALNTLVLLLGLTSIVRKSADPLQEDATGEWVTVGLTGVHLVAALVWLPMACRLACKRPPPQNAIVHSWLYNSPPPPPIYHPPPSHIMRHPPSITKSMKSTNESYEQVLSKARRPPPSKAQEKKEKEVTEEELERTYTGLDREMAEEFISIAMQTSKPT